MWCGRQRTDRWQVSGGEGGKKGRGQQKSTGGRRAAYQATNSNDDSEGKDGKTMQKEKCEWSWGDVERKKRVG